MSPLLTLLAGMFAAFIIPTSQSRARFTYRFGAVCAYLIAGAAASFVGGRDVQEALALGYATGFLSSAVTVFVVKRQRRSDRRPCGTAGRGAAE